MTRRIDTARIGVGSAGISALRYVKKIIDNERKFFSAKGKANSFAEGRWHGLVYNQE